MRLTSLVKVVGLPQAVYLVRVRGKGRVRVRVRVRGRVSGQRKG